MATKTKKIDKDFLITDSSVNVYGFRLLTEGYQLSEYQRNPIGYYMHDREGGVIVRWEDLRVDGDKVYGKPVINLSNEKGQQVVDEIEGGFLNGASVGHIVAVEWSEDPQQMLPGQTGPTITKWYNREASICDVPGNMNALALYDKEGSPINLSDFKKQTPDMKEVKLTAGQLAKLNLTDTATAAEVDAKLDTLVANSSQVTDLTAKLNTALNDKQQLANDLAAEKAKNEGDEVKRILEEALSAKKTTKEMSDILAAQYKGRPVELKALVDTMKPFESVTATIVNNSDKRLNDLRAMSYEDLDKKGLAEELKTKDLAAFKEKFKEHTGKEYSGA